MKALLTILLLASTMLLGGCYFNMSVTKTPPYNIYCPGSGASVTHYRAAQAAPSEAGWFDGAGAPAAATGDCARPGYCSPL